MKTFNINSAICDTRFASEKTLQAYDHIRINSATVLVTPASREKLAQYNVSMNCARVLSLDEDVELVSVNGKAEIKPGDAVTGKKYLMINGKAIIAPGSEEVLRQYVGISVNGKVICPESLSGVLSMMTVNGKTVVYPDDAVLLDDSAVIGKLFALRAKNKLYWSAKRMIMTDLQLDAARLEAKGATFSAPGFIIAESLLDTMVSLIDEKADIQVVPDGTVVVDDDLTLSESALRRYGTRLYVLGDFEADENSRSALEKIEYLHVCGDASLAASVEELFFQKAEVEGDTKLLKGLYLCNKAMVKITKWMLEQEKDGVTVANCAMVKLDADVDNETILNKLNVNDCALIQCTPEQEGAVALICTDVAEIGSDKQAPTDAIKDVLTGETVNCAEYVL